MTDETNKPDENVMRHTYKTLSEKDKDRMTQVKDIGLEFYKLCEEIGPSREASIAKTKIEEAVMWAVKSLTK